LIIGYAEAWLYEQTVFLYSISPNASEIVKNASKPAVFAVKCAHCRAGLTSIAVLR
jgi:hypothetical protein